MAVGVGVRDIINDGGFVELTFSLLLDLEHGLLSIFSIEKRTTGLTVFFQLESSFHIPAVLPGRDIRKLLKLSFETPAV